MKTLNEKVLNLLRSELKNTQIKVSQKKNAREAIDFIITTNNDKSYRLFFKSINADTEQSIKIAKQDLEELDENLFIGLALLFEGETKVLYLIPSTVFLNPNSIFKNNNVMLPHLSNWEIRVFTNAIPELSKYALENMIDKL